MSLNDSPTNPKDNPITFLTGTDNYLYTRSFAKWLDQELITMKRKDYTSLTELDDVFVSPWSVPQPLEGTDGF